MRTVPAVTMVLSILGAGVVGWSVRDSCTATSPAAEPSPAIEPTLHSDRGRLDAAVEPPQRLAAGAMEPRSADLSRRMEEIAAEIGALRREDSTRWAGVASELETLNARMAAIAVTQDALAKKAGVPPPWPSDPAEVEKVRDRWRSRLDETEKTLRDLYPQGPDARGDVVAWSRFDDHRRAKAAFAAATDSASLRALSEGEFRTYFTLTR